MVTFSREAIRGEELNVVEQIKQLTTPVLSFPWNGEVGDFFLLVMQKRGVGERSKNLILSPPFIFSK
jgi:hypothetical protein